MSDDDEWIDVPPELVPAGLASMRVRRPPNLVVTDEMWLYPRRPIDPWAASWLMREYRLYEDIVERHIPRRPDPRALVLITGV